jgi:hypothetical protein
LGSTGNTAIGDSGSYDNVVRIPLGYFADHKLSNMASLREMSNAEIVVNFASTNGTQYRVRQLLKSVRHFMQLIRPAVV